MTNPPTPDPSKDVWGIQLNRYLAEQAQAVATLQQLVAQLVAAGGGGTVDLSAYSTTGQMTQAISTALADYYTKDQVDSLIAAAVGSVTQNPDPTPVSPYKPWAVLGLGTGAGKNHYYAQIAVDGESTYRAVQLPDLLKDYQVSPYLETVQGTDGKYRARLRASVGGPTTSGSKYARTEMRELDLDGSNIAFAPATGTHRQRAKLTIEHLQSGKPEIVIMQLHNGNKDRIAVRTQAISSANPSVVAMSIRVNGSIGDKSGVGGNGWQAPSAYVVGTEYDVMMECVDGTWRVYIETPGTALTTPKVTVAHSVLQASDTSSGVTASSWYQKHGCYLQAQSGVDSAATEYGSVLVRDVLHWHTGWPANAAFPVLP